MNNYYDVLGLTAFENSQEAIKQAYKEGTRRMSENVASNGNMAAKLILFNEAYLVLSDVELKQRYDDCLRFNSPSTYLDQAIEAKRQKAKSFVESRLGPTAKRKNGSTKPIVIVLIVLGLMLLCSLLFSLVKSEQGSSYDEQTSASAQELGSYVPDGDWNRYELDNAFTISIPGTMELKEKYEDYATPCGSLTTIGNNEAMFVRGQRFKSIHNGRDTYCCVSLFHSSLSAGDVNSHDQMEDLTLEDKKVIRSLIDHELIPYSYIELPTYRWVDIAGTKAIEARYRRTGEDGPVMCRFYFLQNFDEIAKVVVTYREKDANLWKVDLEKVITTFKWNNPK